MTKTITPPKNCPSCNSVLEWVKDQLFCMNDSCPTKNSKLVEHFAKSLRIKGLGPKTVDKLLLDNINKIYEIDYNYIEASLKSKKLAEKLINEIEKSKKSDLQTLLPAFSIPLFGRTASEKLCGEVSEINEINADSCKKAGLGPKVTNNMLNWLKNFNQYQTLPFSWKTNKQVRRTAYTEVKGVVCISGKLKSFPTKAIAKKQLEANGYVVKSNFTKDVNILVNESGIESAKTKKAHDNNITVINDITTLIGG